MSTDAPSNASNAPLYRIALDAQSVELVIKWSERDPMTDSPFPLRMAAGDTAVLGERTGADREAAVGALLAQGATSSTGADAQAARLLMAQEAAHAGVPLNIIVTAASYIGNVPVALAARLKIG